MKKSLVYVLLALFLSCGNDIVEAKFVEINNTTARFDIINNSNKDIEKITCELKYFNESNNLILTDTASYEMNEADKQKNVPFLSAHDKTFIVRGAPENCDKAEIKLLEILYSE